MSLIKALQEAKKRREIEDENIRVIEKMAPIRERFEAALKDAGLNIYSAYPKWIPKNSKADELREAFEDELREINATPEKAFFELQGDAIDYTFDAVHTKRVRKPTSGDAKGRQKFIKDHRYQHPDNPDLIYVGTGNRLATKTGENKWVVDLIAEGRELIDLDKEAPGVVTPENAAEGKKKESRV